MSYTKGEWKVKGHNIECIRDAINVTLAHCGLMPVKFKDRRGFTAAVHKKRDKEIKANAYLIAAAPKLLEACKDFRKGWAHFCKKINFAESALDADAIRWMNEAPGQIGAAIVEAEKGE